MSGQKPDSTKVDPEIGSSTATSEPQDLRELMTELLALREFATHYLVAMADRAGDGMRHFSRRSVLAIIRFLALVVLAVSFITYFVRGVDGGLCVAFGHEWLGHLVTGAGGLVLLMILAGLISKITDQKRENRRARKYEERKAGQCELLGRSVDGSAGCEDVGRD